MQVVFIHGSGGCKESWQYQSEYFKDSLAIDLPGHPDGDLCATVGGYAAWLHQQHAANFGLDFDVGKLVLVGHSMGGGVALQYALDYPAEVDGIVLAGSGARLRVHPDILQLFENAQHDASLAEPFIEATYQNMDAELAATLRDRAYENTATAFLNDFRACDSFDVMQRLSELTVPLLAITGDQDILAPPKYAAFLAEQVNNAEHQLIQGAGHFAHIEQAEQFNSLLDDFLRSL